MILLTDVHLAGLVEFGFSARELDEMSGAELAYWFRAAVRLGEERARAAKRDR